MTVYYYLNYNNGDKATEFKRKRKLCDQVFDRAKKLGHDCFPTDGTGMIIHLALDNKAGKDFIVVAESKDILPKIKEEYKFVSVEDYLKGEF